MPYINTAIVAYTHNGPASERIRKNIKPVNVAVGYFEVKHQNSPPKLGGVAHSQRAVAPGWFQMPTARLVFRNHAASLRSAAPPNLGGEFCAVFLARSPDLVETCRNSAARPACRHLRVYINPSHPIQR